MLFKVFLLCFMSNNLLKSTHAIRKNTEDLPSEDLIQKSFERAGISSDIRTKLANQDRDAFQGIDLKEFKKLTPDLIATAGDDAIKDLNPQQISMMVEKLYEGDERNLMKIFSVIGEKQLNIAIDKLSEILNRSGNQQVHLNCVQFEPIVLAIERVFGIPENWSNRIFDKLGKEFVQCLPPDLLRSLAKNKDLFKSMLNKLNTENSDEHQATKYDKKSLLNAATTAFGAVSKWKADDIKSARSLVTMLKPNELKQLDTTAIKDALDDLGQETWNEKRGKELVTKLKDSSKGFGAIATWTSDVVKKLGNLRTSLSKKELGEISEETLRKSVREFGQTAFPPYKTRVLGKRIKALYGSTSNWTREHIKNASNLLGGIETEELLKINDDALLQALPDVKDLELPKHKGRILAKKIQKKMGDPQNWDKTVVKQMGSLMKDLPSSMLKRLKPDEAKEAVMMLRTEKDVPKSKKRALLKQIIGSGNGSKIRFKELGDFVSEVPITELLKLKNVDEILPFEMNSTNITGGNNVTTERAHWQAVQARAVIGDIITKDENWGPVSEFTGNWELKNIKKLGRLALGLKRSDINKLSLNSFTDFVAEFSQISNWTLGQAKTIAKRFLQAHESREPEMTVTDMASLGDFVVHVIDEISETVPTETAREAVRIIGTSRLSRLLPKAARKRKVKVAMNILGKDVASLNSDELEDLGYLVSGFTPQEIGLIRPNTFVDSLASLGDIDGLDKETTDALAAKTVEAYGGSASFDGEILHTLGNIVESLGSSVVAEIPTAVLEENIHVFAEANIEPETAKVILQKTESVARRKRRDMSSKTADDLIAMGSTLLALTPSEIMSLKNDTVRDAIAEISSTKGLSTEQLQAWARKSVHALGELRNLTEDQLLTLNEFAKGFTTNDLRNIAFTSVEVIESFGNNRGYTSEQITALWQAVKNGRSMNAFTGDDLAALGVIASGMSLLEISEINSVAYQDAALELGKLDEWLPEQLEPLKDKAIAAFGAVYSWTPAEMSLAGAIVGSFTAHEIESITADQLDAIAASSFKHIPANIFKEFSVAQLSNLSGEQVTGITDAQKSKLSTDQKDILIKIETAALGYKTGGCRALEISVVVLVCSIAHLSFSIF